MASDLFPIREEEEGKGLSIGFFFWREETMTLPFVSLLKREENSEGGGESERKHDNLALSFVFSSEGENFELLWTE